MRLPETFAETAQDGSSYDGLVGTGHGWLSDCSLDPGATTRALRHRAHDEIWYVRAGRGQVWRHLGDQEEVVDAEAGTSIPAGTAFQFRTQGDEPFRFLIIQAPPWPDESIEAAFTYATGPWEPTGVS